MRIVNGKYKKQYTYLVIDQETDLPVTYCDSYGELQEYLACSFATLWRMIKYGQSYKGQYIEKVYL